MSAVNEERFSDGFSGACSLLVFIAGRYIYVANAGDCRAMIGRRVTDENGHSAWKAIALSRDHTAETEETRLRNEHPEEPDVVMHGRVKGLLEPSRGIGDGLFKSPIFNNSLTDKMPLPFNPPYTVATPEVCRHEIRHEDEFLVLATDGLWEKVSNEEIVQIVGEHDRQSTENVCNRLVKRALLKSALSGGSPQEKLSALIQLPNSVKRVVHDDITATVIFLNGKKLEEMDGDGRNIPLPAPEIVAADPPNTQVLLDESVKEFFKRTKRETPLEQHQQNQ